MSANDRQVGGSHYKRTDKGEEHWDRVYRLQLDYFQAQITKYVERHKLKNGVEDLKKARHFLDKYIELMENGLLTSQSSKFKTTEAYQKTFPVPSGTCPEPVPNHPEESPHECPVVKGPHQYILGVCGFCGAKARSTETLSVKTDPVLGTWQDLNLPPGDRSGS